VLPYLRTSTQEKQFLYEHAIDYTVMQQLCVPAFLQPTRSLSRETNQATSEAQKTLVF
jgi:hypothetical protein